MKKAMQSPKFNVAEVQLIYKSVVPASQRRKITCSRDANNLLKENWNSETLEHFVEFKILLLNRSNSVLGLIARKTFATTVALSNGINIGVLSKILGHNSIKVTLDSYGKIIDELMLSNVKELKEKLSLKQQQDSNTDTGVSPDAHINLLFNINDLSKN